MHKDQIDGNAYTIPAENIKEKRDTTTEFHVPLSSKSLKAITPLLSLNEFLFSYYFFNVFNSLKRMFSLLPIFHKTHSSYRRTKLICHTAQLLSPLVLPSPLLTSVAIAANAKAALRSANGDRAEVQEMM
ncbi:hypothetical protein [Bartonella sp. DB5-6]|uniref:hypothetical protein n=1 Tax=Bartonella sp. DB5-6 TaxID=1094755 RepID=UPI000681CED4|nr:hypothetical protein [Bartonella sp. DB5-6]